MRDARMLAGHRFEEENRNQMSAPHPQAREMADESMVRNLAAQAEAIWPQEKPIFERRDPGDGRVLDVGCGTGEITGRLAELFPRASFDGIDIDAAHLEKARARSAQSGSRVQYRVADATALPFDDATFELAVCRHLLQAVADARRVVEEMLRVVRPGGRIHLISEDYGMIHCYPTELDADGFWQRLPRLYGESVGCDLHIGRKTFTLLHDLGLTDIAVDYVVVDTVRVPRETFARIWEAWRDGYTDSIAEHSRVPREEIERRWREMIDAIRDPRGYAVWQVPVWTATKPG